jgi:hypothetical protein
VDPGRTDVGSTIVEDEVGLPVFHSVAELLTAVRGGDIGDERVDGGEGTDGVEVGSYGRGRRASTDWQIASGERRGGWWQFQSVISVTLSERNPEKDKVDRATENAFPPSFPFPVIPRTKGGSEERTDDETSHGHVLGSDLKPSSRSRTQIDADFRMREEVVFLVQLD